jgi:hypothetical protein
LSSDQIGSNANIYLEELKGGDTSINYMMDGYKNFNGIARVLFYLHNIGEKDYFYPEWLYEGQISEGNPSGFGRFIYCS